MTNSLIPYTFVPGTKARASEVNANFAAVAEAIDSSNASIGNLTTEMNAALEKRMDLSMSNSGNITNCIVSAPNGVASFSSLTITAKSGLKVLIPNGRNSDGSLKNIIYSLQENVQATDNITSGDRIFAVTSSGTLLIIYKNCFLYGNSSDMPETVDDTNTYVYFAKDENKMYTTTGSTTADWTSVSLCTIGCYKVINSTIYDFTSDEILTITNLANKELSNLTDESIFNVLKPTNRVMKLKTSGLVALIELRNFYKSYSDECFCAMVKDTSNYMAPLLVGETERSVTGYDDNAQTPTYEGSFVWHGKTFYYHWYGTSRMPINSGVGKTNDNKNFPFLTEKYSSGSDAGKAILELYYNSQDKAMPAKSYLYGKSWYRIWGDGWIEQGGFVPASGTHDVTFLIPFINDKAHISLTENRGDAVSKVIKVQSISATGFTFQAYDNVCAGWWYACGY